MPQPQMAPGNKVIAFRALASRIPREVSPEDTERGRILFFTGVRYQRMETEASAADPEELVARVDDIWA